MPLKLSAGVASGTGPRDSNEDATLVRLEEGHFVLADGTGGRAGGKTAAHLACEAFQEVSARNTRPTPEELMSACFEAAHRTVREQQRKNSAVASMSTTLVAAIVQRETMVLGHVGDSRAYRLRRGQLQLLTEDHSYANYLAQHPDEAPIPGRPPTALTRAIGIREDRVRPDVRQETIEPGDRVLLCSDGVSGFVPDWVLVTLLEGAGPLAPDQAAGAIVSVAHALGSTDNASAIVLHAELEQDARTVMGWLACLEGPQQGLVARLGPRTLVGADESIADVVLLDGFASSKHAEIVATRGGFQLRDLDSKNGTYLNESTQRVRTETLVDGDRIRFGGATMVFRARPIEV